MVSIIVAASSNNVIGKNNQLIWHLPNDLTFFKNTTWGSVVIMGRKTFESVNRALPGRINIVVTKQQQWQAENVISVNNLSNAIEKAKESNCKEIFVIGGGEIYKECIPIADRIYMTRVHAEIDGDTFFPPFDEKEWILVSNKDFKADDRNAFDHSIQIWDRKTFSANQ